MPKKNENGMSREERFEKVEQIVLNIEKVEKQKKFFSIIISVLMFCVVIWLFVLLYMMVGAFNYLKSDRFIGDLKLMTPYVTQKMGEKLKEVSPQLVDELKDKLVDVLPALQDKVMNQYVPEFLDSLQSQSELFVQETLEKTEQQLHDFVYAEVQNVFAQVDELNDLNDSQFQELKEALISAIDKNVQELFDSEIKDSLEACIYNGEKIFVKVQDFTDLNIPEDERKEFALDVLKSFLDGLNYFYPGALDETLGVSQIDQSEEGKLYELFKSKFKEGDEIPNLTNETWRNTYPLDVRKAVYEKLEKEGVF